MTSLATLPPADDYRLFVISRRAELAKNMSTIAYFVTVGLLTCNQATEMGCRELACAALDIELPELLPPRALRWVPMPAGADQLRAELAVLTAEQMHHALLFLSGVTPAAVRRALLAIMTPGSTLGTAP